MSHPGQRNTSASARRCPTYKALEDILQAFKQQRVFLITSRVTLEEVLRVPEPHQSVHVAVWETLFEMPTSRERILDVATGGWGNHWRLRKPKQLLPDENDARQLWQAWRNEANIFITVDRKRSSGIQRRSSPFAP